MKRSHVKNSSSLALDKYLKEFLKVFFITMISVGCVFVSTNYLSRIIDHTVNLSLTISNVVIALLFYFVIQAVMTVINVLYSYLSGTVRKNIVTSIRLELLDTVLQKMSFQTYMEIGKKKLDSIFINDVAEYGINYYTPVIGLINNYFRLAVFIAMMFYYHYILGFMVVGIVIILWFCTKFTNQRMEEYSKRQAVAKETFINEYGNIIHGWIDYKTTKNQHIMEHKLVDTSQQCEAATLKYEEQNVLVSGMNSIMKLLVFGLIFAVEIYLGFNSFISLGKIVVSITILSLIQDEVDAIITNLQKIATSKPIKKRIMNILESDNKTDDSSYIKPSWSTIRLKDITFAYEGKPTVLSNYSCEFIKGNSYAIVGRSGIGKSTIIKIMLGLVKGYDGNIYIDETCLSSGSEAFMEICAYLDQELYLFEDTIENNIYFGDEKAKETYKNHEFIKLLDEYIDDYSYEVKENGSNLSGGQKQLIGVARAIVKGKSILIFDETFSAVNESLYTKVENVLLNIKDITYITITHRHANMEKYDFVIHMEGGQ